MRSNILANKEFDNLSRTLKDLTDTPIWVAWQQTDDGRKLPINPATGRAAKSDSPDTWGSRKAALRRAERLQKGRLAGVGVMFAPIPQADGWRLCGVDLDGCFNPKTGALTPWAIAVINRFGSYAERSPSGTGAHVLFLCRAADFEWLRDAGLVTPKGGVEFSLGDHTEIALFLGGRYFTVTDDQIGDQPTIRPVERADLEWLIRDHGPAFKRQGKKAPRGGDESGSGIGFKFACDRLREGKGEEEARAEIAEDDGEAGEWWRRAGERQQDRAIKNALTRVTGEGAEIIELFDNLDDPDVEAAHILGIEPPGPDEDFELDEDGVIRAFTTAHKDELRFDHAAGSWFRFDNNSWQREETKLAHHYPHLADRIQPPLTSGLIAAS
jgi:hypothetical protein